jgi:hypothetical protein
MTDRYAQSPKLSQYSFLIVAIIKFDAELEWSERYGDGVGSVGNPTTVYVLMIK